MLTPAWWDVKTVRTPATNRDRTVVNPKSSLARTIHKRPSRGGGDGGALPRSIPGSEGASLDRSGRCLSHGRRVYFTIVTNLKSGRVVWIGDGKGRRGLLPFLRALGPKGQLSSVMQFSPPRVSEISPPS